MSQPFSRYLHPFDAARHPSIEPEVKRAILASWTSDRNAVENQPAMRKPPEPDRPVPSEEAFAALRSPDGQASPATMQ